MEKKRIAALLVAKLGAPKKDEPAEEADDPKAPLKAAAEDVLAAVKADNASDLADALKACFDLLDGSEDEPE